MADPLIDPNGRWPLVALPPDHWIVQEWEKFTASAEWQRIACWPLEKERARIREFMWVAFAAGAQSIPGNPERVADLERQLAEVQVDGRVRALEMGQEDLESRVSKLESYCNETLAKVQTVAQTIDQVGGRVTGLESAFNRSVR